MDKGNCSRCGQKIQKTTLDKCMYCGAALKFDQMFTEEEKDEINFEKKLLKKELQEKALNRIRQGSKGASATGYPDLTMGDSGF